MFPAVKEAVARLIPPASLRYVAFSHVEADECGTLNDFLALAPAAVPVCSRTAALVSVNDLADRPPRALADGETLSLGKHAVRWHDTPHLPHGWESGLLSDATSRTLFCGDLFTHGGAALPPVTEGDILGPSERTRAGMDYYSHPASAAAMLRRLAALEPATLALMHGSSWRGDGAKLLTALADALAAGT
jgi:flavorubredoxin